MTAMEPPISFDADEVRNKQAEVLHAIQPPIILATLKAWLLIADVNPVKAL